MHIISIQPPDNADWTVPLAERLNSLTKVMQHWTPRRLISLPETHPEDPGWGDLAPDRSSTLGLSFLPQY